MLPGFEESAAKILIKKQKQQALLLSSALPNDILHTTVFYTFDSRVQLVLSSYCMLWTPQNEDISSQQKGY